MATYVVLLRAVNVGGTGKLAMSALRDICQACGFRRVQTYIASGNVVLEADGDAAEVQAVLEKRLEDHVGQPLGVLVRSAAEIAAVLAANPFPERARNLVHVLFLDRAPPADPLAGASGRSTEEIAPGLREIYIHYPQGQGASKLKLPAAKLGTARNINTVAKLAELAQT
jgi:uncharacterized protein (DUF1697 family)